MVAVRNNILTIVVVCFAVLALGYSAFWHYTAWEAREAVKEFIDKTNSGPMNFTLSYTNIAVKGFPIAYRIVIETPKLEQKNTSPASYLLLEAKEMVLGSNLQGDRYTLSLNGDIAQQYETANEKKSYILHPQGECLLSIHTKAGYGLHKLFRDEKGSFMDKIQEISYTDAGFSMMDSASGAIISTSKKAGFTLKDASTDVLRHVTFSFLMDSMEGSEAFMRGTLRIQEKLSASGEITFTKDILAKEDGGNAPFNVAIKRLIVSLGAIELSAEGQVMMPAQQLAAPIGEVRVVIKQVQQLVDFLAAGKIIKDAAKLKESLKKIAEKSDNADIMEFLIKGDAKKGVAVGTLTVPEMTALFSAPL